MSVFWSDEKQWIESSLEILVILPHLICTICYCTFFCAEGYSLKQRAAASLHLVSYTQCCSELRQQCFPFIHFYLFFHPSSLILFRALCFLSSCSDFVIPCFFLCASVPLHFVSLLPLCLSFFFSSLFLSPLSSFYPFNIFSLSHISLCFTCYFSHFTVNTRGSTKIRIIKLLKHKYTTNYNILLGNNTPKSYIFVILMILARRTISCISFRNSIW